MTSSVEHPPGATGSCADTDSARSSQASSLTDAASETSTSDMTGAEGAGLDVLAALACLGISDTVRQSVQQALEQLDAATTSAGALDGVSSSGDQNPHSSSPKGPLNATERQRLQDLEKKFAMSRSVMRKLYHRNVELEKEIQVMKANTASTPVTFTVSTAEVLARRQSAMAHKGTSRDNTLDDLVVRALQERDATVQQLQQALDTARRRCALLESQSAPRSPHTTKPSPASRRPGAADSASVGKLREVLAQSQMHYSKYRQIREDYNRLLKKRAGTLASSKAASSLARGMLDDMKQRLHQELTEREAEAALYSAKLYETEKQMSDWYVERRMLEEQVARLHAEIAQRDQIDAEMETCMCGLFERLKLLEQTNEELRKQVAQTS